MRPRALPCDDAGLPTDEPRLRPEPDPARMRPRAIGTRARGGARARSLGGCGGSDETSTTSTRAESTTTQDAAPAPAPPDEPAPTEGADSVDLYFTAGEQFAEGLARAAGGGSEARAHDRGAAARARQRRRRRATSRCAPRSPTACGSSSVEAADGSAVTVELSDEFDDGLGAARASAAADQRAELAARVGQLTYTLTQLDGGRSVRGARRRDGRSSDGRRARTTRSRRRDRAPAPSPRGAKSPSTRKVAEAPRPPALPAASARSTASPGTGPSRR